MNKRMEGIVAAVIIILAVLSLLWYRGSQNMEMQTISHTQTTIQQVQTLVSSQEYAVEVTDIDGESHVIESKNKTRLAELVITIIQPIEKEVLLRDTDPHFDIRIFGGEPLQDFTLTIYDKAEETDIGVLHTEKNDILVTNCGEILNYLAELGFATQR